MLEDYRKISNMKRTKSQNVNLCLSSRLTVVSAQSIEVGCEVENEDVVEAMLQLHLSGQQFYCLLRCDIY